MIRKIFLASILTLVSMVFVSAQTQAISGAERAAIARLWSDVNAAVQKRDRASLERIYAEDFTHVHASGKIDDRGARLATLLSGEATIDTASEIDFALRKYGETIIAVGMVKVTGGEGKVVTYSVTRVYVRSKGKWRFAASQASRVESN
jgi:hypothetical protein